MSDQEPRLDPGSPGTEEVWQNIDRAYATEQRHQKMAQTQSARQTTMTTQIFQSQMLGLMLIGESEQALVPGNGQSSKGASAAVEEAVAANP